MQFLPVVQRELVVAGRRRSTYWSRVASAAIALAIFTALVVFDGAPSGRLGFTVLQTLAIFIFLECIIAGLRYTCDCLSEERREGTLGLLFLTGLSGWDVVLGKMLSRSLGSFYNLLAAIPIFSLPLLLGGVTGAQVTALSVSFLVALIFSLSAGIYISSRGTGEREVLFKTLLLIAMLTLLPPVIYVALAKLTGTWGVLEPMLYISPAYAFREAERGFAPGFIRSLWVLLGVSLSIVGYAAWKLRSTLQLEANSAPKKKRARPRPPAFVRQSLLRINPMVWLVMRDRPGRGGKVVLCSVIIAFGIFCRVAVEAGWNWLIPFVVFGSYGVHALYKFIIVAETSRRLTEDRRSGALELLLSTPLPPRLIIKGQLQATRQVWRPLLWAVALMNLTWMTEEDFLDDIGIFLPVSLFLLVTDSRALAWVALRNALQSWRYSRVIFQTYFKVMGPPILTLILILMVGDAAGISQDELLVWVFFWGLASAGYDWFLIRSARRALAGFRKLAAGDFPPRGLKSFRWSRFRPNTGSPVSAPIQRNSLSPRCK